MKFLRHFAVVVMLVSVIVGLGLAWNKFAPSTLLGYQPTLGPVQYNSKLIRDQPGPSVLSVLTNPVNWKFLRHTVVIEVLVLAAVVILDVIRRRLRRIDRSRDLD
jgi:hypothetical protein